MENFEESGESSGQNSIEFNFLLVNSVKSFPVLYAKSSKLYRNAHERDKAWLAVAKTLGMPVNTVKQKWRNLRDRYGKELRNVENSSASGAGVDQVFQSKWALFEELAFLSDHCQARPTTGNYKSSSHQSSLNVTQQISQQVVSHSDDVSEEILEEEMEIEALDDPEMTGITPNKRNTRDLLNSSGKASKKRKTIIEQADIDEKIDQILAKADTVLEAKPTRHASFCSYLTERLEMLPLQAARDLEVEFTLRVNAVLDLYGDKSNE